MTIFFEPLYELIFSLFEKNKFLQDLEVRCISTDDEEDIYEGLEAIVRYEYNNIIINARINLDKYIEEELSYDLKGKSCSSLNYIYKKTTEYAKEYGLLTCGDNIYFFREVKLESIDIDITILDPETKVVENLPLSDKIEKFIKDKAIKELNVLAEKRKNSVLEELRLSLVNCVENLKKKAIQ